MSGSADRLFDSVCRHARQTALLASVAEVLGYSDCRYDALLDDFEPEERTANIVCVLGDLRDALVPLVAEIQQSGRQPDGST